MYSLVLINDVDNLKDYKILYNSKHIGNLELTLHKDNVFIRHITIFKEYRRCGHASNIVDYLLYLFSLPVSLCVSQSSESAINFWENYFNIRNVVHIRGNIYEILSTL